MQKNASQLIVALDVPDSRAVPALLDRLPDEVQWYKVGLELYCAAGRDALHPLIERGKHIFLDLKLHDIPRTVAGAVQAAAGQGVRMMTVHAAGGTAMLRAAARAAAGMGEHRPLLVAVTTLTSLDAGDLRAIGIRRGPRTQALALADMAIACGMDGVVTSPLEVNALRKRLGPKPVLVTPGIRLPGDDPGDQKRLATPARAVQWGASHLVVGRPILQAADPARTARRILDEIAAARCSNTSSK